jgi:toxin ParE1/3/4
MAVITKLPQAKADLAEIWNYIADDSEAQADVFIDEIDEKFSLLAENPAIGRVRLDLGANLRSFPCGRYVIFYGVVPDGIQIVRVLHGARDLGTAFQINV